MKQKNYKNLFFIIIFLLLFSCAEKKETVVQKQSVPAKKEVVETSTASTVSVKSLIFEKYVYDGLSYRDPFVPLSGEKVAKAKLGVTGEAVVPPIGSLQLKGFIVDKQDKIALFSSPYGSYLLVNGKLYDRQNRLVKGYSGKIVFNNITNKPQSVILITEENEYKEFTISE
jgi:hypothetical protein